MSGARIAAGVLLAGWLANALAAKDADVEAGISAYDNGEYEEALARFDVARERRPERPELSFNRGLALLATEDTETAQTAFETATEAEDPNVRASAFYELGNIALDAEDYDAAIERYIESLKARPDHANAKWNLELALSLIQKQEEEQEQNEDEQNEDEQNEDEQNEDEQDEDEQEQNEDEQNEDEQNEDEQEQDEQEQDEQEQEEQEQEEQEQEEQEQEEQEQSQQPRAIDEMDVQKALEQLDEQDPFTLDRPVGGYVQPDKDW